MDKPIQLKKEAIPMNATSFSDLVANTENERVVAAHKRVLEEFESLSRNIAYSSFSVEEKYERWEELANGYLDRIKTISTSFGLELELALDEPFEEVKEEIVSNAMITEGVVQGVGNNILENMAYMAYELKNDMSADQYDQFYMQKAVSKGIYGFETGDVVRWELPGNFGVGIVKAFAGDMAMPIVKIQLLRETDDGTFTLVDEIVEQPAHILSIREDSIVKEMKGSFTIQKSLDNGKLFWYGTFTNNFMDRHKEIISKAAHKEYVANVNSGLIPKPPLVFWHIPKAIGTTEFIEYLEEGFVAAGGFIYEEYENLISKIVKSVQENGEQLGMSHRSKGMIGPDNVIKFYYSEEITMLPLTEAANLLTTMSIS